MQREQRGEKTVKRRKKRGGSWKELAVGDNADGLQSITAKGRITECMLQKKLSSSRLLGNFTCIFKSSTQTPLCTWTTLERTEKKKKREKKLNSEVLGERKLMQVRIRSLCKMKLLGFEQGNQIGHVDQVYYCRYLVKHSINTILMLP